MTQSGLDICWTQPVRLSLSYTGGHVMIWTLIGNWYLHW